MPLVVRPAANTNVRCFTASADRAGNDVIQLQESARLTPPTLGIDEGALLPIASKHLTPNLAADGTASARTMSATPLLGRRSPTAIARRRNRRRSNRTASSSFGRLR